MEKGSTGTRILLPLRFLEIDSQFGELNRARAFAGDGGTEYGNPRIHFHRLSIDHGLAGELLVDCLSLKHEALGLRDKQSADPREYLCALGDLIAKFADLLFEVVLLEDQDPDLQLCFSFRTGH
jgi:hypothetical protein